MVAQPLVVFQAMLLAALALSAGTVSSSAAAEPAAEITNSINMKLVLVPAGEFLMGAEEGPSETLGYFSYYDARGLDGESPQHRVRITKPFYLGQHEVTIGQFLQFCKDTKYKTDMERDGRPSLGYAADGKTLLRFLAFRPWAPGWKVDDDHPVVFVSWNDATAFCQWLSKKEGKSYRLPTEAEWEYACRAGTTDRYHFGDDPQRLVEFANVADADRKAISGEAYIAVFDKQGSIAADEIPFPFLSRKDGFAWTAPFGSFRANPFGLYDMHGNVWEWCSDWYGRSYYASSPKEDPQGPADGRFRVARGGAFLDVPANLRCANRDRGSPSSRDCGRGFRVARDL